MVVTVPLPSLANEHTESSVELRSQCWQCWQCWDLFGMEARADFSMRFCWPSCCECATLQPEEMEPLGTKRIWIAVVTLIVFALCFWPFPITIT